MLRKQQGARKVQLCKSAFRAKWHNHFFSTYICFFVNLPFFSFASQLSSYYKFSSSQAKGLELSTTFRYIDQIVRHEMVRGGLHFELSNEPFVCNLFRKY